MTITKERKTKLIGEWLLRDLVRVERVDLTADLPPMPTFDVVFLRNVLHHFEDEVVGQVTDRVGDVVAPDGYLVLGASESSLDLGTRWARETCGRATVQRPRPGTPSTLGTGHSPERSRAHPLLMTGA